MLLDVALVLAALSCALVSGFLFGFAVVAMPGLGKLGDREFVRAFQAMDRVIQNRAPLFMVLWVGSVVALVVAVALGFGSLEGGPLVLLVAAAVLYLGGLQVPTAVVNIPLNNELQRVEVDSLAEDGVREARERFEERWNRWNAIRTLMGCLASLGLLVVLLWA